MSNSIDPDETAHYEPSHLDLYYLQKPILSPMAVKEKEIFLDKSCRGRPCNDKSVRFRNIHRFDDENLRFSDVL